MDRSVFVGANNNYISTTHTQQIYAHEELN